MEFVRITIDSTVLYNLFDIPPALRDKKVDVIILPAQSVIGEKIKQKIQLGFVKGPPLPESFFDPLPEEELQAWGL